MGAKEYCHVTRAANASAGLDELIECEPVATLYLASLYWAIMTITSVGYGDVSASLHNQLELAVVIVVMVVGSFGWAQVLATFVTLLTSQNEAVNQFRRTMDDLNKFMHRRQLPHDMQIRLREYFRQIRAPRVAPRTAAAKRTLARARAATRSRECAPCCTPHALAGHLRLAGRERDLMAKMSPQMQSEVAWACHKHWVQRVWFFHGVPTSFLISLARNLTPLVFAPGESAPLGSLYIVSRGLCLYAGRVLGPTKVWGTDVILASEHLRLRYCGRAMNYLEVYSCTRTQLETIADYFPLVKSGIRRHAIRLAIRRAFIAEADRRLRASGEGTITHTLSLFHMMLEQASSFTSPEDQIVRTGSILAERHDASNSGPSRSAAAEAPAPAAGASSPFPGLPSWFGGAPERQRVGRLGPKSGCARV